MSPGLAARVIAVADLLGFGLRVIGIRLARAGDGTQAVLLVKPV